MIPAHVVVRTPLGILAFMDADSMDVVTAGVRGSGVGPRTDIIDVNL